MLRCWCGHSNESYEGALSCGDICVSKIMCQIHVGTFVRSSRKVKKGLKTKAVADLHAH